MCVTSSLCCLSSTWKDALLEPEAQRPMSIYSLLASCVYLPLPCRPAPSPLSPLLPPSPLNPIIIPSPRSVGREFLWLWKTSPSSSPSFLPRRKRRIHKSYTSHRSYFRTSCWWLQLITNAPRVSFSKLTCSGRGAAGLLLSFLCDSRGGSKMSFSSRQDPTYLSRSGPGEVKSDGSVEADYVNTAESRT